MITRTNRLTLQQKPHMLIRSLILFTITLTSVNLLAVGSMKGAYIEIGDKQTAFRTYNRSISERVLLPSYETFALQSEHLLQVTQAFCMGERTDEQFTAVKNSWNTTMSAWVQTQAFRFGPALDDNIDLKIQFWPDDKGLVSNRVEQLLNGENEINVAEIAKSSAPAQGLPAMEYLIFIQNGDMAAFSDINTGTRRCAYLQAAAENLRNQAEHLKVAWGNTEQGFIFGFAYSGSSLDDTVAFATLLRENLLALEVTKNHKVGKPFGLPEGSVNALFLESWRSRRSKHNIISNLITLQRHFYGGSYFGLDDLLVVNYNQTDLEFKLRTQIAKCLELASSLPQPLFDHLHEGDSHNQAEKLQNELIKLIALIKQDLARLLGITIGFSSNDGD